MTREDLEVIKEVHREIWNIGEKIKDDENKYRILEVMDKLYDIIEKYKELES